MNGFVFCISRFNILSNLWKSNILIPSSPYIIFILATKQMNDFLLFFQKEVEIDKK